MAAKEGPLGRERSALPAEGEDRGNLSRAGKKDAYGFSRRFALPGEGFAWSLSIIRLEPLESTMSKEDVIMKKSAIMMAAALPAALFLFFATLAAGCGKAAAPEEREEAEGTGDATQQEPAVEGGSR